MKNTDKVIFDIVYVVFWILFIGLLVNAGAMTWNYVFSLGFNPKWSTGAMGSLKLGELLKEDRIAFIRLGSMVIFIECTKAYTAYLVIKLFSKFKLSNPFTKKSVRLIENISYASLQAGIVALIAEGYSKHIMHQGNHINLKWGAGELLFFAGVIYLLAQVFKKGFELQSETDLTV